MQTDILTTRILSTNVHVTREVDVLPLVKQAIDNHTPLRIGVVNAAKLIAMRNDPVLYEDVSSSDLVLADGMSVVWASKLTSRPLPERIAGIDLMFRFFELADKHGYSVFLLGATEEISETVASNLSRDYPGAKLAGRRNGYFSSEQDQEVADAITNAAPDILLVAMTSPKKENFMGKFGPVMNVPIVHGVGGSFDVYAGKVERAPESWQRMGLEWLYRVKQEPGRLWKRYAKTNFTFAFLVIVEALGKLVGIRR